MGTGDGERLGEEGRFLLIRQGRVNDRVNGLIGNQALFPDGPEFGAGADGGVFGVVLIGGNEELGIGKELGNVVVALVVDELLNALFHVDAGGLALDDDEGDAVDESDNVGATGFDAAGTLDGKFGGDVEGVVLPVAPVDVAQAVAFGVLLDGLLQAGAEGEQVVDVFVGFEQAIVFDVFEALNGFLNVGFAEVVLLAPKGDAVEFLQFGAKNRL
jgi:hypothetical protein